MLVLSLVSMLWFSSAIAVSMGKAATALLFKGVRAGCDVVFHGRHGASRHSQVSAKVSKVVFLCGRRNTCASFSEDELQSSWQAQHFGELHRHFAWHCALHTPHFTLHTPHFTHHTPHSTLHSALYTPHLTLHTSHCTLYTLHFLLHTPHKNTSYFTLYTLHFMLHTPHYTLYTLHSTLYTLYCTLYTHTSHSTLHTLDYTLHPTIHTTL